MTIAKLVDIWVNQEHNEYSEMEIRFGVHNKLYKINETNVMTNTIPYYSNVYHNYLSATDYNRVLSILLNNGYSKYESDVSYKSLRIFTEKKDYNSGSLKFISTNIRVEIITLEAIQYYLINEDLLEVYEKYSKCILFTVKGKNICELNDHFIKEWNFSVCQQYERTYSSMNDLDEIHYILNEWKNLKKTARYLNRLMLYSSNYDEYPTLYPYRIDMSIIKQTSSTSNKINQNILNEITSFEIEIEFLNQNKKKENKDKIIENLQLLIRLILSGLQNTSYPISYVEQNNVTSNYIKQCKIQIEKKHQQNLINIVNGKDWVGPSVTTLQIENILLTNNQTQINNICNNNYIVSDKTDGERHLLFIDPTYLKMYMIDRNMRIKYIGGKINNQNSEFIGCIIDGEYILNMFIAFDIYWYNGKDIRHWPFYNKENIHQCRYTLLKKLEQIYLTDIDNIKLQFIVKYYEINETNIFNACSSIYTKKNILPYPTDGFIFMNIKLPIPSISTISTVTTIPITTCRDTIITFKWKPPQYNTIDFLVMIEKDDNYNDKIYQFSKTENEYTKYNNDINNMNSYMKAKKILLYCGFHPMKDGLLYPMEYGYTGFRRIKKDSSMHLKEYIPTQFYANEPYDEHSGECYIELNNMDEQLHLQHFDGSYSEDIFTENQIIEFAYDIKRPSGWRWIPLKIRYEKTERYQRGEREYGNSYRVCQENWNSIHSPITENMLINGNHINLNNEILNISSCILPFSSYYHNKYDYVYNTIQLRKYHNTIKRILLQNICTKTNLWLIDFACGKAGDLHKWNDLNISFVLGLDISQDNLCNRLDGAWARYCDLREKNNLSNLQCLFLQSDVTKSILNGDGLYHTLDKQVWKSCIGKCTLRESKNIGNEIVKLYNKIKSEIFPISTCFFAIHYFWESEIKLDGFLNNLVNLICVGGYFACTCFDGELIFELLKNIKKGEKITSSIYNENILWSITKEYNDNDNKLLHEYQSEVLCNSYEIYIGNKIKVYQESIHHELDEYLVHIRYFIKRMEVIGFQCIQNNLFTEIHDPQSFNMNEDEKRISYLNRGLIFQKTRTYG